MRAISFGLSVLALAACTVHIGEGATDSAGGTEASTGSASTPGSSSGEAPTTSGTQGTGEASTGPGSTGEATGSTGEATGSTGGGSSGSDETGLTGGTGTSGGTGGPAPGDATIDDSCAPDDGPALEFRLELPAPMCGAQWSGDVLRVMLYQGGPLAPGSYALEGGKGFAWLQQGDLPPVTSEAGTLVIDAWDGETVSGSYMLPGLKAEVIEGSFAGPHCPAVAPCG